MRYQIYHTYLIPWTSDAVGIAHLRMSYYEAAWHASWSNHVPSAWLGNACRHDWHCELATCIRNDPYRRWAHRLAWGYMSSMEHAWCYMVLSILASPANLPLSSLSWLAYHMQDSVELAIIACHRIEKTWHQSWNTMHIHDSKLNKAYGHVHGLFYRLSLAQRVATYLASPK